MRLAHRSEQRAGGGCGVPERRQTEGVGGAVAEIEPAVQRVHYG